MSERRSSFGRLADVGTAGPPLRLRAMVAAAERWTRRWAWLVLGWCLVALGVVLHAAAAADTAAFDPLEDVVAFALQHGWVRAAAWAAVTGGAWLVVAGWSRRSPAPANPEQS